MPWHILPVNDIKEHTEESTCICCPQLKIENGEMIFVHNSFDRREEKEVGYILGQRALRRSQSGHDLHETWKVFTINETYLQLIREFPNDYKPLEFTHYWINGFGWENTVYQPYEFQQVEKLGENEEGIIFLAENEFGTKHIFLKSNN